MAVLERLTSVLSVVCVETRGENPTIHRFTTEDSETMNRPMRGECALVKYDLHKVQVSGNFQFFHFGPTCGFLHRQPVFQNNFADQCGQCDHCQQRGHGECSRVVELLK